MDVEPYDPAEPGAPAALWQLKESFERELAGGTGGEAKRAAYDAKLTDAYRERYLEWVRRCVRDDPRSVVVARPSRDPPAEGEGFAGYAFVLPERLAMIWDAAVLNEIYVDPDRRGTGVADRLMETVLATARDQDLPLDRLVLDVDRENDRARAFYRRHGFEHWGEMVARDL
ncbi:MAG: N-acetyltransferase [Halobacteriales archaeon]